MVMGVIGWIVLGLIAGYFASTLASGSGKGLPINIGLGIAGAVVGGWIFHAAGASAVTGFNLWSLLVAVAGAVVLLVAWHVVRDSVAHA